MRMALSDFANKVGGFLGRKQFSYTALPENVTQEEVQRRARLWVDRHQKAVRLALVALLLSVAGFFAIYFLRRPRSEAQSCECFETGFQCEPTLSHSWGQYSPFYSVPSDIPPAIPPDCVLTFAQVLSRHGARDPTAGKSAAYASLFQRIHASVPSGSYGRDYAFIANYEYSLGADELSHFGQQQMVNSGKHFYARYQTLARSISPFIRSAGQKRVVDSAVNWTQGFHEARLADSTAKSPDAYPYAPLVLPEVEGFNNTLSPSTCPAYSDGPDTGAVPQSLFLDTFAPVVQARVNENLPGANLTTHDVVSLMDMCPFETVAREGNKISRFCRLFTEDEWNSYDYYQSLGKWYGYGNGSPLGPTQGVGFINELIARLTAQPVSDQTSTNTTLDGSRATFPLDHILYADFSHDNDMTGVFGGLGLYNATEELPIGYKNSPRKMGGYSAAWTVPFAARMYVEKMQCRDHGEEELVRVLVNDRVIPLLNCDVDELGRCTVDKFVESLEFARSGGFWNEKCYAGVGNYERGLA
ncbi:histidine phosphatase superfamily [Xylariaceae sp. FL0255]|nr:histidine phosphatase superfamily [Xylariaceae sp. FL0255]